ncbi:hypothetical protein CTI12_AA393320 [Artemisia annua]|uniref:Cytochrome f large domain-containing protein n=1 Tax=Artemisia annua TaxID=35608 RepID=A0A2U1MDH4_ARTAN|nr:hypothetical protein CTI12_AA393320 [Artemisia annua]
MVLAAGYRERGEKWIRDVIWFRKMNRKPVDIEVPQAVLPDTVFEAVVRIPYDMQLKQVLANGYGATSFSMAC